MGFRLVEGIWTQTWVVPPLTWVETSLNVHGWTVACAEMAKSIKIKILLAVHVVKLSWASIVIILSFLSLDLGGRALP